MTLAAGLFHELGYRGVSLGDVAAAAGITGPGVYRHFANKEALLAAAVTSGLDLVEDAVTGALDDELPRLVDALAEVSARRPDMWVLLQRESRLLSPELRDQVGEHFSRILRTLAGRLLRDRPGLAEDDARLLMTAATSVLALPRPQSSPLDTDEIRRELSAAALRCLDLDLDLDASRDRPVAADEGTVPGEPGDADTAPRPRREQIVDVAVDLFFRDGYSGVSLDDIGAAAGLTGPSVLHHFPGKADILAAAFDRAATRLAAVQSARPDRSDPSALEELVDSYVGFALADRGLVGIYVTEPLHLAPEALEQPLGVARRERRDWVDALGVAEPGLAEPVVRLRVTAALTAVNDLVRLGRLVERPRIRDEIGRVALAVLRGPA